MANIILSPEIILFLVGRLRTRYGVHIVKAVWGSSTFRISYLFHCLHKNFRASTPSNIARHRAPKIVRDELVEPSIEVHNESTRSTPPLRPLRQRRQPPHIRVQVRHKTQIIARNTTCLKPRLLPIHHRNVTRMERAQHRRAIVITTQITPTINLRPSLIHPLQKHTACNGEHQIPEQSREALVLRIDVVEGAGAEWRSRGGVIGIEVQQLREPGGGGVMEEEGGEVGDDVGGCGDV